MMVGEPCRGGIMTHWKLLLLRHAKSSWAYPELEDFDRPLKKRGRRNAREMGQFLAINQLLPDVLWCSEATRTKQTLKRVLHQLPVKPHTLVFDRKLYHASKETLHQVVRHQSESSYCLMIVGHNPGMEDYLQMLAPNVPLPASGKRFPTAALAVFEAQVPFAQWCSDKVRLTQLIHPRTLPKNVLLEPYGDAN